MLEKDGFITTNPDAQVQHGEEEGSDRKRSVKIDLTQKAGALPDGAGADSTKSVLSLQVSERQTTNEKAMLSMARRSDRLRNRIPEFESRHGKT
jgi:hypothetical protein